MIAIMSLLIGASVPCTQIQDNVREWSIYYTYITERNTCSVFPHNTFIHAERISETKKSTELQILLSLFVNAHANRDLDAVTGLAREIRRVESALCDS